MLAGKTIVFGITGGISAYKAADIASKLTQAGAKVDVLMTEAATKFITPLTLHSVTHRPVITDIFGLSTEHRSYHILMAETADIVLIAPATANTIAKLAHGIADNVITTTVLATKAPVIIAPAMNDNMLANPITRDNIAALKKRGFVFIEPAFGILASGKTGKGRLPETQVIIDAVTQVFARQGDLAGKRVVVTAGGTQEPIDAVRHITNRSSGKMGYALAEAARDHGAEVTLVTAPCALPAPSGIKIVPVGTAAQMRDAVKEAVKTADALIMAAAVADYQPKKPAKGKIKKEKADSLNLELIRTPDILAEVNGHFIKVGFAAESSDLLKNARRKLAEKNLDLIVANDITGTDCGFDVDTNRVTIIDRAGKTEELPLMSKREVAERVVGKIVGIINK